MRIDIFLFFKNPFFDPLTPPPKNDTQMIVSLPDFPKFPVMKNEAQNLFILSQILRKTNIFCVKKWEVTVRMDKISF